MRSSTSSSLLFTLFTPTILSIPLTTDTNLINPPILTCVPPPHCAYYDAREDIVYDLSRATCNQTAPLFNEKTNYTIDFIVRAWWAGDGQLIPMHVSYQDYVVPDYAPGGDCGRGVFRKRGEMVMMMKREEQWKKRKEGNILDDVWNTLGHLVNGDEATHPDGDGKPSLPGEENIYHVRVAPTTYDPEVAKAGGYSLQPPGASCEDMLFNSWKKCYGNAGRGGSYQAGLLTYSIKTVY